MPTPQTFKSLRIGQTFDFVGPDPMRVSFWLPCVKISARKYQDASGVVHHIGSVQANVYHVDAALDSGKDG